MFGDIGWNLDPDRVDEGLLQPVQTSSIETAPSSSYRSNNQSVSSSSSEDLPEKSTVSDE
ncbi:WRKY family transcription factor, partial [Trifolium medium]|nr:WRKY family transcription factor [Trifolium medium]